MFRFGEVGKVRKSAAKQNKNIKNTLWTNTGNLGRSSTTARLLLLYLTWEIRSRRAGHDEQV